MKIIAVANNYPQHNNGAVDALYNNSEPVVYFKPDSALLKDGKPFFLPDHVGRVGYGGELVVRICRLGKNIPRRFAHRYYDAVTVGVSFTASDWQQRLRQQQLPWAMANSFDGAAVIGSWVAKEELPKGAGLHFRLAVNGDVVQEGFTDDMLHGIDGLIACVSRFSTLKTGDLLYTGTPAGLAPAAINDHIEGWVEDKKVLRFNVK